ncbi:hypothetical protein ES332_D12G029100v1 [Gossypium tomentosum]|uniref:Uncharacterized protein n=1 Tax=Gossypium tomentosum TaxID=34277 RepID=A0A5D2I4D7_GOSTO|nr:hypothetical protein ES332_D12G029100v1 [Gossypium tomentosum]
MAFTTPPTDPDYLFPVAILRLPVVENDRIIPLGRRPAFCSFWRHQTSMLSREPPFRKSKTQLACCTLGFLFSVESSRKVLERDIKLHGLVFISQITLLMILLQQP